MAFLQVRPREGRFRIGNSIARSKRSLPVRTSCFGSKRTRRRSKPDKRFRISDEELASRLSYFLWSTTPDDELLELAAQKTLSDPVVLESTGSAHAR